MSERKVLNKYYPKDYDPGNIPRAKRPKNRQWTIRTMAPFNMRCNTCGEYVYKGKKFNSRQEVAEGETYLGLKIFRFYIKCPKCVSEITFKTDPQSVDYVLEAGATRNFEALRTAELMAQKEAAEKEAELANNPMKMLENRTAASQREMDMIETLEDLRELNSKHATMDMNELIEEKVKQQKLYEEKLKQLQDDQDESFIQSIFGKNSTAVVKRLSDSEESGEDQPTPSKIQRLHNPTDFLTQDQASTSAEPTAGISGAVAVSASSATRKAPPKSGPVLVKPKKNSLGMLVKKKEPSTSATKPVSAASKPSLYEMVKQKEANLKKSNSNAAPSISKAASVSSSVNSDSASNSNKTADSKSDLKNEKPIKASGLGLVAGYSYSDESSEND